MTTERNVELLNEVADFIEFYPERHSQVSWVEGADGAVISSPSNLVLSASLDTIGLDYDTIACGTTQCVAGWAAVLTLAEDRDQYLEMVGGCNDDWWELGAHLLWLDCDESDILFNSEDIYDFPAVLREIANGEDVERALWNNERFEDG